MTKANQETIVALSSAPGRAGVAVVRVSGPACRSILQQMAGLSDPVARMATLARLRDPKSDETIDHALVLFFPAPHSFTGEDVVEFHLHGGRAIVQAALTSLCAMPGVCPAEAGAFSRRAFDNGKLDLTEVEGIADLIDAETAAQRRQALRQMEGALGALYAGWAERLTHNLAYIEAEIDFADEDIPPDLSAGRREDIAALSREIAQHLNDAHRGERLREGFTVALLGAPNAGKSSLLNALAQREVAIVDPTPGTTRDIIEVQLDLGGYPVTLSDTAGLRASADAIESEGIRRALARAEMADFKLLVFDGSATNPMDQATLALLDEAALIIVNKTDLGQVSYGTANVEKTLHISAKTGEGLQTLAARLIQEIEQRFVSTAAPALTRARHRQALDQCQDHLSRALQAPESELCAEDLRLALRFLGRITGRVDVEDLLDIIFSSFCIGK